LLQIVAALFVADIFQVRLKKCTLKREKNDIDTFSKVLFMISSVIFMFYLCHNILQNICCDSYCQLDGRSRIQVYVHGQLIFNFLVGGTLILRKTYLN